MSTIVGITIIVVIAAIIAAWLLRKKGKFAEKKLPLKEPIKELAKEQVEEPVEKKPAEEPADELVKEQKPAQKAEVPRPQEPKIDTVPVAPGVRLDDSAEQEATEKLEQDRRERKIKRLRQGLAPTRGGFIKKIESLFQGKKEIDSSLLTELEETLISLDVGAKTTGWLIDVLKQALDKKELNDSNAVWDMLKEEVRQILSIDEPPVNLGLNKPYVILVVGVNGVGKTTTIGKLATQYIEEGHKVVLAAADTFRAAAVSQLEIWAKRSGADIVKSKEGADPSSVVFDSIKRAKETGADIVIADTAGRLHTKVSLMEEVKKIARVAGKAEETAPHQILLVLDATTGQNAVSQVEMFKEAMNVNGLVITKLDGTAKGGVIIGICHEHKIPIRFIGIGEAKDDLRKFDVDDFVEALFIREGK